MHNNFTSNYRTLPSSNNIDTSSNLRYNCCHNVAIGGISDSQPQDDCTDIYGCTNEARHINETHGTTMGTNLASYAQDIDSCTFGTSTWNHELNTNGDENMSFAIVTHFGDFAIAAADTRSTTKYSTDNRTSNDDYTKIVQIPNTNIIALSTGTNMFCGRAFEEIVSGIEADNLIAAHCKLTQSIRSKLLSNESTWITICEHIENYTVCVSSLIRQSEVKSDLYTYSHSDIGKGVFSGQTWATTLANQTSFSEFASTEQQAISKIRNFLEDLIDLSPIIQGDGGTIGGCIDIVLLKSGCAPEFLPRYTPTR
jgi:hypothetical protein